MKRLINLINVIERNTITSNFCLFFATYTVRFGIKRELMETKKKGQGAFKGTPPNKTKI